jgi:hypothetical protein
MGQAGRFAYAEPMTPGQESEHGCCLTELSGELACA